MKDRPRRSSRCLGLTLIEVLAALALLGGTAATLLTACTRVLHQRHETRLRREAYRHADELILTWTVTNEPLHRDANGAIPKAQKEGHAPFASQWFWSRSVRPIRVTAQLEMNEITVTIEAQDASAQRKTLASVVWLTPRESRED